MSMSAICENHGELYLSHEATSPCMYLWVAANQIRALAVDVDNLEHLVALEGIEPPPGSWCVRLRRLVVSGVGRE